MNLITDPLISAVHTPTAWYVAGALLGLVVAFVPLTHPIRSDRARRRRLATLTQSWLPPKFPERAWSCDRCGSPDHSRATAINELEVVCGTCADAAWCIDPFCPAHGYVGQAITLDVVAEPDVLGADARTDDPRQGSVRAEVLPFEGVL
jgi:hypothetical protein